MAPSFAIVRCTTKFTLLAPCCISSAGAIFFAPLQIFHMLDNLPSSSDFFVGFLLFEFVVLFCLSCRILGLQLYAEQTVGLYKREAFEDESVCFLS